MSYREENGQVILTMSSEDFQTILLALGAFTGLHMGNRGHGVKMFEMLNRLNEGNPHYKPYAIGETGAELNRQ